MNKVLEEKKKQRAAAKTAAVKIKGDAAEQSRRMSEDERRQYNALMAKPNGEFWKLTEDIEVENIEADADDVLNKSTRKIEPEIAEPSQVIEYKGLRHGKLTAFKGPDAERNAYRSGMWLKATLLGDQDARDWCRNNAVEARIMTTAVNSKGGAVVPTEMENAIIDLREEYGIARQSCDIIAMPSDHMIIPRRTGGVTAYAVGETVATTESDMAWDNVELTAKKWGALTRMSTDLAEDAVINMADRLAKSMAWAFAKKEDECLIDGDGTSTYHGIVGFRTKMVDGSHAASHIAATAGEDTFPEMLAADLDEVMATVPQYADGGAKWYTSKFGFSSLFGRLMAAGGGNTMVNLAAGPIKEYMGYPVVLSAAMPGSGTYNGTIMVVFGDMAQATTMGTRRGITVKVDGSRYLEYDQLAVMATERFDIVVHDIGDASTAGPLVGLEGNS